MGESIADVVRQHLPADRVEQVSISVHHQLVLSCAWLNIKVKLGAKSSSFFLRRTEKGGPGIDCAKLNGNRFGERRKAPTLPRKWGCACCATRRRYRWRSAPPRSTSASVSSAGRCSAAAIKVSVALHFRNRTRSFQLFFSTGAIEGAGEALAALCRRLLARAEPPLRAVPGRLLSSLLDRFEQPFVGVSITRRSAGMALLVGKIVASEPAKSEVRIHRSTNRIALESGFAKTYFAALFCGGSSLKIRRFNTGSSSISSGLEI